MTEPAVRIDWFGRIVFPTEASGDMLGCPMYFYVEQSRWGVTVVRPGADAEAPEDWRRDVLFSVDGEGPYSGELDQESVMDILRRVFQENSSKLICARTR